MENDNADLGWEKSLKRLQRLLRLMKRNDLFDEEKAWQQFRERIGQEAPVKPVRSFTWVTYAAAALIPLLGMAIYYLNRKLPVANDTAIAAIHELRLTTDQGQVMQPGALRGKQVTVADGLSLVIDSAGVIRYMTRPGSVPMQHTLEVPAGKTGTIQLPDGTMVWLNSTSKLSYTVSAKREQMQVNLLYGEACFDVPPLKAAPLAVQVQDSKVYVLGTCFDVKAGVKEGIQATLVSGRIKVARGKDTMMLAPDEQAVVDAATGSLVKRQVIAAEYIAWKENVLYFDNARLEDITHTLAEIYHCRFLFKEAALKELHFTVDLEKYPQLQPVLQYIGAASGLSFKVEGNEVMVSRKPE